MLLHEGEEIQFEIGANLRRGIEYVGGLLTITNKRLFFKPHAVNIQTRELTVPLEKIHYAKTTNVMGIVPSGLLVQLFDDTTYIFSIEFAWMNKREKLVDYIEEKTA